MTIGIYALYWEDQDLIYVGQSQRIERRYLQHLNNLKLLKHSNFRVQDAYNRYGIPKQIILECCEISNLTALESVWLKELDALNTKTGLCLIDPLLREGVYAPGSKYSILSILRVFRELYLTNNYYVDIASKYGVPAYLVEQIKSGTSHMWLCEKYPYQYDIMITKLRRTTGDRSKYNTTPMRIISPSGQEFEVVNCKKFAREHFLDSTALSKVCRGIRGQHKGWHL